MKLYTRVKYTGAANVRLGAYDIVVPGEEFSMRTADYAYLKEHKDSLLKVLTVLGESDEQAHRVQPSTPEAVAVAEAHEESEKEDALVEAAQKKEAASEAAKVALAAAGVLVYDKASTQALKNACVARGLTLPASVAKSALIAVLQAADAQEAEAEKATDSTVTE